MKKAFRWFLNYAPIFNIFLFIIVAALLILKFGIYLNPSSINVLLSITAVVSNFFLYLAFKESKKTNDYNTSQPLFLEYENQVEDFKGKLL